jgi:hypothetical protein
MDHPDMVDQPLLTDQEIADYGPEFVDVVHRASLEATRPLLHKVGELEAQVDSTTRRLAISANDEMHEKMNALVPGWQQVNNSEAFVAWANTIEPYSGWLRRELMREAWNAQDAGRVSLFFRAFAEQGGVAPTASGARARAGGLRRRDQPINILGSSLSCTS